MDKKPKEPKKNGRPTKFNQELADLICHRIATHPWGLKKICNFYDDMPKDTTILEWRMKYDKFSSQYAKAKLAQADALAEDCLNIADDDSGDVKINNDGFEVFNGEFAARSRIRIDTRKWLASKLLPKQYGDKLVLEQKTEENEKLKAELLELRAKLDEQHRKDY
jgi:hypothetical protein